MTIYKPIESYSNFFLLPVLDKPIYFEISLLYFEKKMIGNASLPNSTTCINIINTQGMKKKDIHSTYTKKYVLSSLGEGDVMVPHNLFPCVMKNGLH